ncbi:hypothetical protein [Oceanobacillus alkalisoli]|uniref:hypothetical protein n=1 Tax=Oceanobacillus alkalisoli TaxID=2925113 RepID=UPI001F119F33|nr:hypothetical protein [Oceanobacillus alkalisoli]MCF3943953.1 hypothetical protein [Oceanobacillus alkalisoli]
MKGKWTLAYGGIAILLGVLLAQFIRVVIRGDGFTVAPFIGTLPVSIILIVVNIIQVKRKSDSTPNMDERTLRNILKFQIFASQIFIGLLFLSLIITTFLSIESVPTSLLWIIVLIYMCLYGIGTLIVKSK